MRSDTIQVVFNAKIGVMDHVLVYSLFEACTLETYNCPSCLKKEGKEQNLENKITSKNQELIKAKFNTIIVNLKQKFFFL